MFTRSELRRSGTGPVAIVLVVMLLALSLAPHHLVEQHYSRGLYPAVAAIVIPLSDLAPFSLTAVLLVLLPAALWLILRWRRQGARYWAGRIALMIVLLYAVFLLSWGLNYGRTPLEAKLELAVSPADAEEVRELAMRLGEVVHETLPETRDRQRALASIRRSLIELVADWEGREIRLPRRIKTLPPGLLLFNNAAGTVSPFTLEAHVESALPDYKFVAVAAHELSHLAGYAGEAEADFIGAVAGLRAEDPFARYAVALSLFESFVRRLPESERRALVATLPDKAVADLAEMRAIVERYPSPLRGLQTWLYDLYLRLQGVAEGVEDYGRVVDMLVAAERQGLSVLDPALTEH
jgi:hypothetical protein